MDQQTQPRRSGSYTANLLGNIRSHLAGLQGYDVMALELIQNADDAKADSVVFDITDRGLLVVNSGKFTYCGDLHTRPCSFIASSNYSCDYHRIADVGSGGSSLVAKTSDASASVSSRRIRSRTTRRSGPLV